MAAVSSIQFVKAFGRVGIKELVKAGKLSIEELKENYNEGYVAQLLQDPEFMNELKKLEKNKKKLLI
jgi:hypothetical protein